MLVIFIFERDWQYKFVFYLLYFLAILNMTERVFQNSYCLFKLLPRLANISTNLRQFNVKYYSRMKYKIAGSMAATISLS